MEKRIKTNILIEFDNFTETVNGMMQFANTIKDKYPIKVRCVNSCKVSIKLIEWSDVVLSIRSTNQITARISQICKKYNRFFIYQLDDNLFLHKNDELFKKIRIKYLKQTIENADVFLSSNPNLNTYVSEKCNIHRFARMDTAANEEEIHK